MAVFMLDRARGGKTKRTGVKGLDDETRHGFCLGFCGRFERRRAIAHHIGAHGGMGNLQTHIQRQRRGFDRIHIIGKALPVPLDAFRKGGAGNILDAFHEAQQPVALFGFAGGETDTAIAHHGGGDAMECRGLKIGVPCDLSVIMGVDVDETRCDDLRQYWRQHQRQRRQ